MPDPDRRRHSTIDHLAPELRSQVDDLVLGGIATYEEIVATLAAQGIEVSLSAVGRYAKRIRAAQINAGEARRLMADIQAAGGDVGAAVDTLTGQAVYELLNTLETAHLRDNPDLLFAFAALQRNFLRSQEIKLKAQAAGAAVIAPAPAAEPPIEMEIKSPADAVAALKVAMQRQLNHFLAHRGTLNLAGIKDVKACWSLIQDLEAQYVPAEAKASGPMGISDDLTDEINRKILGLTP